MTKEYLRWQQEVRQLIDKLNELRDRWQKELQAYYPSATVKLSVRNVLLDSTINDKADNRPVIYLDKTGTEYIITTTGASDTEPHPDNWKIYVSYKPNKI